MTEKSRTEMRERVAKLNDNLNALKNHPLPPAVALLNERLEALSLGDIRPTEAPRPATNPAPAAPTQHDTTVTKRRDGLPTPDIAELFDGAPYPKLEWKKRTSDRKWLEEARLARGEPGGAPAMWCPLNIGKLVWGKYPGKRAKLQRAFQNPVLAPWRDEWDQFVDLFSNDG